MLLSRQVTGGTESNYENHNPDRRWMTRPRFKLCSSRIQLHQSTWFLRLCEISDSIANYFAVRVLFTACHVCTILIPADFGQVLLQFHQALHKLTQETCRTPNKISLIRRLLFFDVIRHAKRYTNASSANS
jgi:hypothetical protein